MAFLIFLLIIILLVFYYLKVVCPIVVSLSEEKIRSVSTYAMSEAVGDVIIEENLKYDDIVKITYSGASKVEMIEIDSMRTNLLIREVTKSVQTKFDNLGTQAVDIALGTFTGIPFLYGLGPNISVQLVPIGTINTKLNSTFISAGINQTIHRINFVISASIGMILPAKTQNYSTELEVLLCESVIMGEIPNFVLQGKLI